MDRITPPRTEYPPPKKKMKILGALNDCAICRGSHFNILPMPKPNQTTENEMNNAIKATKTYGFPIPPLRVNCQPILQKGVTDIMLKPPLYN